MLLPLPAVASAHPALPVSQGSHHPATTGRAAQPGHDPPRADALGWARCVGRHVGAARQPNQLLGGRRSHRAGHQLLPAPQHRAAAGCRRAAAYCASRLHHGPCTTGRHSCGARRQDHPLLVARGQVAARHRRPPLPAWRVLARGGVHPAGVGATLHGRHAVRRRLLRRPLGAALPGSTGWRRGRPLHRLGSSGPQLWQAPPDPDFQIGLWLVTA